MSDPDSTPPARNSDGNGVACGGLVRRCVTHHFGCDCREARFRDLLEDMILAHSTPDNGNYNECDSDPCAWCVEANALIYHGHPDGVIHPTNDPGMARRPNEGRADQHPTNQNHE